MFSREFIDNKILQWALGAQVFNYFLAFFVWVWTYDQSKNAVVHNQFVCPAHFQDCGSLYVFESLASGYSHTLFYMILFGLLFWCAYAFSKKDWQTITLLLLPIFFWHTLTTLFMVERIMGNFDYYIVAFGVVLLFLPHKEFFLKLTLVTFYAISTVAKNHPAWIEGTYFSTLRTGLPLFPEWSIPLWTNLVILMEMVGAWFLFSKNRLLQRGAFIFFVLFHMYSGILVAYRYPAIVLPMLFIVFGPWFRHTKVPLDKRSIAGWCFIAILFVGQFTPRFIAGDDKLTLEGSKYGLSMFESNHQCISEADVIFEDGRTHAVDRINIMANERCNPYAYWFELKQICARDERIERIDWTFDHSINGEPFLRIVDVEDACALQYNAFGHNEWIKTHGDDPEMIGLPVKNRYW